MVEIGDVIVIDTTYLLVQKKFHISENLVFDCIDVVSKEKHYLTFFSLAQFVTEVITANTYYILPELIKSELRSIKC